MEEFLIRLQESDFGVWVSSAPTLLAYPTILMLHTVGLAMVVGPAAVLDLRWTGRILVGITLSGIEAAREMQKPQRNADPGLYRWPGTGNPHPSRRL